MTGIGARGAATGTGDRSRPRAALPALCATQITSWGIVFYAFPVLNPAITAGTGWSAGATTAAFSLALLISAFAGIRVGRIIDHRGPRAVMTTGSVFGVLSILIVAVAPNLLVFPAGRVLAGFATAATFYQPAFAAITRWWAPDHIRALTIITLAGGLASTLFTPLTAALRRASVLAGDVRRSRPGAGRGDRPRARSRPERAMAEGVAGPRPPLQQR